MGPGQPVSLLCERFYQEPVLRRVLFEASVKLVLSNQQDLQRVELACCLGSRGEHGQGGDKARAGTRVQGFQDEAQGCVFPMGNQLG